jgi:hypothetical protein
MMYLGVIHDVLNYNTSVPDVDGVAASVRCPREDGTVDCQEATHRNYFGRLTEPAKDESTMGPFESGQTNVKKVEYQ